MTDAQEQVAVKLPSPNEPAYERARLEMANHLFAIGRQDARNGYGRKADALMCGDLMDVPTWLALGMIAATRTCQTTSDVAVREALGMLEHCASDVARLGAQTGTQWLRLSGALIAARTALASLNPTPEDEA